MRVLLLKTWLTNIGNGFIDAGAEAALNNAFPNAEIIPVSGYSHYAGDFAEEHSTLLKKIGIADNNSDTNLRSNMINNAELISADIAVLPGCILYEHSLRKYLPVLKDLENRDIPVLLLGAGGGNYEQSTATYVQDILGNLTILGIITRDSTAYDEYQHIAPSYDGIDCAFWIDEYYQPPAANKEIVTATFDKTSEPNLTTDDAEIVRPDHQPYGNPWNYPIANVLNRVVSPPSVFDSDNQFMSDTIEDYLFLYANASETHTDRIHAAVPTLVYGNPARFYYETPRANLFDRVLSEDITSALVTIDRGMLEEERSEQEKQLRQMVTDAV